MKRIYTLTFVFVLQALVASYALQATSDVPPSLSQGVSLNEVETLYLPHSTTDVQKGLTGKTGLPHWAGFSLDANVSPIFSGSRINWSSGEVSWMLKATSPGAPALALVFEDVEIPRNSILYVYSESNPEAVYSIKGSELNSPYISTPPMAGETIIVEYFEPVQPTGQKPVFGKAWDSTNVYHRFGQPSEMVGNFFLAELVVIYNGAETMVGERGLGDADVCLLNINCSPEGDNWQVEKRGVARILLREGEQWGWCSGTLINNTSQNGTPYFLTAEHCGGNASTADFNVWQFSFNFERPGCENTGNPTTNMITGCSFKAKGPMAGGSDFLLVQLNTTPPQSWNPYFNGWDRSAVGATGGVGIHHPVGDAKKISTYTGTLVSSTPNIEGNLMATNGAWRVFWVATTNGHSVTEGGSSGSPLFNANGQVVGTLAGGASYCDTPNQPDFYGKFNFHWDTNGTENNQRLQPWLDPSNTGVTSLGGFNPYAGLQVNFTASQLVVDIDEEINFTDQSSGGEITSWSWDFGHGAVPATANGQGPHTVSYATHGYKTVSLTVNGQHTVTKTNYIYVNESVMITQSQSQNVVAGSSVACADAGINVNNSYFRVFDLANDHSITDDFEVRIVDVGVETASGNEDEGTPIQLKLHTASSSDLSSATLTNLHQENFMVPDMTLSVYQLLLAEPVVVPGGSILVVEIFTPSGVDGGHNFFIGSNAEGQNSPSYILAPGCGIATISSLATIGYPNMHLVLNVWGGTPDLPPYSVTYMANNAAATGDAPIDTNEYEEDDEVTVLGSGTLQLEDHYFDGWSTQTGSSGTIYQPNATFSMPANNVTLFAVWKPADTNVVEPDSDSLNVFPNPTKSAVNITSSIQINKLELLDMSGRIILKRTVNDNQTILDVSNIEAGVYVVRIETINGIRVIKLQVQ